MQFLVTLSLKAGKWKLFVLHYNNIEVNGISVSAYCIMATHCSGKWGCYFAGGFGRCSRQWVNTLVCRTERFCCRPRDWVAKNSSNMRRMERSSDLVKRSAITEQDRIPREIYFIFYISELGLILMRLYSWAQYLLWCLFWEQDRPLHSPVDVFVSSCWSRFQIHDHYNPWFGLFGFASDMLFQWHNLSFYHMVCGQHCHIHQFQWISTVHILPASQPGALLGHTSVHFV